METLLTLIILMAIVAVIFWAINYLLPADAKFKMILNVLVVLFVLVFLIKMLFGVSWRL